MNDAHPEGVRLRDRVAHLHQTLAREPDSVDNYAELSRRTGLDPETVRRHALQAGRTKSFGRPVEPGRLRGELEALRRRDRAKHDRERDARRRSAWLKLRNSSGPEARAVRLEIANMSFGLFKDDAPDAELRKCADEALRDANTWDARDRTLLLQRLLDGPAIGLDLETLLDLAGVHHATLWRRWRDARKRLWPV